MRTGRLVILVVALIALIVIFAYAQSGVDNLSISASPTPLQLTQAQANSQHTVTVGATVTLTLIDSWPVPGSSLVWQAGTYDPARLEPISGPLTSPSPQVARSQPVSFGFLALGPGPARIVAHGATTCEAMAKANCPDKDLVFYLNIVSPAAPAPS